MTRSVETVTSGRLRDVADIKKGQRVRTIEEKLDGIRRLTGEVVRLLGHRHEETAALVRLDVPLHPDVPEMWFEVSALELEAYDPRD